MKRSGAVPFASLAALLAVYLAAPLLFSLPRIVGVDWRQVDWPTLGSAAWVSTASATLACIVIALGGIPLGYWLARRKTRSAGVIGFVVQLPLALPPLTSGILLLFLLGPYSMLGELGHGALTDSFTGIVLAGIFVAAPFLIVAARSSFAIVDPLLEDVAATLGRRRHARFFKVALPLAWPGIRAGLLLSWLRAFGEFGATMMVAYHPYSLPVYTYVAFGSQGLPAMMPIILPTLILALIATALVAGMQNGYWKPSNRGRRWLRSHYSQHVVKRATLTTRTPSGKPFETSIGTGTDATTSSMLAAIPSEGTLPSTAALATVLSFSLRKDLPGFTLDVAWSPRARRLAILGESGSGKSMTLRLLAGLEAATSAEVLIDGIDIGKQAAEDRHIAYVPQDYGLFPHLSVSEQWAFATDTNHEAAKAWAMHLGLGGLEHRLPAALSLGQRQRVAIVRALARPCPLILLDEPFAALDTPRRKQLRDSLRQLQNEITASTVIVTHDPDEAALLADEILVIDRGQVLQHGTTREIFATPASTKVAALLGLSNIGEGALTLEHELLIGDIAVDVRGAMLPSAHLERALKPTPQPQTSSKISATLATTQAAKDTLPVMWRFGVDAIRLCANEGHSAVAGNQLLVDGRPHLQIHIASHRLLMRADTTEVPQPGSAIQVSVNPLGIECWLREPNPRPAWSEQNR